MSFAGTRKILGILVQVAFTAAALTYVFHDPRQRARMAEVILQADWRWLVAGFGAYGTVEILAAVRWKLLLHIQRFDLGWARATAILFVSEFFLTFTPGLVGGDAMRIYYLIKVQPEKKVDAFTAVLMDRIMGMVALLCLAAVILTTRYHWLSRSSAATRLVQAVAVILGVGAAMLLLALIGTGINLPAGWRVPRQIHEFSEAFRQFGRDRRRTALAFVTTVASHACYYTSFCCAAQALGHLGGTAPTFRDVFSIMPIENTLTALPVSFAGIGLRESLFQTLLHDLSGVPTAVGALIGTVGFATKLLWSLPGAVVFLNDRFTREPAHPSTPDSRPMESA